MEFTKYNTHKTLPAHTVFVKWQNEFIGTHQYQINSHQCTFHMLVYKSFFNFLNKARTLLERPEDPQPVNISQAHQLLYPKPDQKSTPSYLLKIRFKITLPSKTRSSKWLLSLSFLHRNPECASLLSHTCYMHRASYSS